MRGAEIVVFLGQSSVWSAFSFLLDGCLMALAGKGMVYPELVFALGVPDTRGWEVDVPVATTDADGACAPLGLL